LFHLLFARTYRVIYGDVNFARGQIWCILFSENTLITSPHSWWDSVCFVVYFWLLLQSRTAVTKLYHMWTTSILMGLGRWKRTVKRQWMDSALSASEACGIVIIA